MFRAILGAILGFLFWISLIYLFLAVLTFATNFVLINYFVNFFFGSPQEILISRIIGVCIVIVYILYFVFFYRCSNCKKLFSLRKDSPEFIRDVIETKFENGFERTYSSPEMKITYNCKYCGFWKSYMKLGKAHRIR